MRGNLSIPRSCWRCPRGAGRPAAAGGPGAGRRPGRRGRARPTGDPGLDQALAAAAGRLDRLPAVRAGVDGRLVPPERVVEDLDALVAALFGATPRPGRPAGGPGHGADGPPPPGRGRRQGGHRPGARPPRHHAPAGRSRAPGPGGRGARAGLRLRLAAQERRLRGQLALAGGLALVTLAAALLGRGLGGRDRRAPAARRRSCRAWPAGCAGTPRRCWPRPVPSRPGTGPQPLVEVVRAAVAEAEPGGARRDGRIDLLVAGEVAARGPVAVDLVHLLAELLDTAAAFSSPAAPSRSARPPTATAA